VNAIGNIDVSFNEVNLWDAWIALFIQEEIYSSGLNHLAKGLLATTRDNPHQYLHLSNIGNGITTIPIRINEDSGVRFPHFDCTIAEISLRV